MPPHGETQIPFAGTAKYLRKVAERANDPLFRMAWTGLKWLTITSVALLIYAAKPYVNGFIANLPIVTELKAADASEVRQLADVRGSIAAIDISVEKASRHADKNGERIDAQLAQNAETLKTLMQTNAALQELKVGQSTLLQSISDLREQQRADRQSLENRLNAIAAARGRPP